jgi:hypothetical protein
VCRAYQISKFAATEMQRRCFVCAALPPSCLHLPIIDTPSARGASPSQFSHHMKMWPWFLSQRSPRSSSSQHPHQLMTSCLRRPSRRLRPPRGRNSCGVVTSACRTKSSVNLTLSSFVLDVHDPAGCHSRLVEEEVHRREAEGKRLVFVLNEIGMCASP